VLGPVHKHRWIYAAAKGLLERVLHAHGLNSDLEYTIIRPFNFLGSRIDYLVAPGTTGGPRVFAHFMSALMSGGPMLLVDGGHVHRAFTHVQDANEAFHILLAKPDQSRNEIFNVGNPTNDITIRELAHLMSEIYGELTGKIAASEIREISGTDFYGEGYEDSSRLPPDIRKLEALGWTPKCDLRSALRDAMAYYLQRGADLLSSMPPDRRTVAS
jgi:UDP-apiose/xylose synthase